MRAIFTRTSLLVVIILFGILYFTTVTSLSVSGEKISALKYVVENLTKENRLKTVELSERFILANMDKKAQEIGMIPDTKFVYINNAPSSLAVSKR